MPWYVFAFFGAVFFSFASLAEKRALTKLHSLSFASAYALLNFVFSLPLLFFIDFRSLNREALLLMIATAALQAAALRTVAKGMRHLDFSTAVPLMALNPGAAAVAGFLFLGEHLSRANVLGILAIIAGSYILAVAPHMKVSESLKRFFGSKYIIFILFSVACAAGAAALDRTLMNEHHLDPLAYLFFVNLFVACIIMILNSGWGRGVRGVAEALKADGDKITIISLLTIAYSFFELRALELAFVGLVSTIKRVSSLIAALVGGEIFHEDHLLRKSIASLLIIFGCALIVLLR